MPPSEFLHNLLVFGRLLRALRLEVHLGRLLDVIQALQRLDLARREDVYITCRTLLVHRHEDFAAFDRAFAIWVGTAATPAATSAAGQTRSADAASVAASLVAIDARGDSGPGDGPASVVALRTWSDAERLASRDFGSMSGDELDAARAAIAALAWEPGNRRTRRWVRGRGPRIDLRRALAASLRTAGEITTLPRRRRRTRPRPIVLLCDVSGSMEQYSRTLLHFAHALARRSGRVEAFVFATRLTRITRLLRAPRADAAMAAASRAVRDWSGGTRIGAALRTFHQRWRRQTLHSGPVVLLISDGWDCGEPAVLRDEIARLRRSCHRLIWLNPLIGTADFAPLTRGLQAALPFVDDFLPVRTLRDVRDLALHLDALDRRRT